MKIFILIFLLGVCVLFGAIILNFFAAQIGFVSWYEFLQNPKEVESISYFWLFFFYPLALGFIAYSAINLFGLSKSGR